MVDRAGHCPDHTTRNVLEELERSTGRFGTLVEGHPGRQQGNGSTLDAFGTELEHLHDIIDSTRVTHHSNPSPRVQLVDHRQRLEAGVYHPLVDLARLFAVLWL